VFVVASIIPHGNDQIYFRSHRVLQCSSFVSSWFFNLLCIFLISWRLICVLSFRISFVYVFLIFVWVTLVTFVGAMLFLVCWSY
jgi:hypothetical protein